MKKTISFFYILFILIHAAFSQNTFVPKKIIPYPVDRDISNFSLPPYYSNYLNIKGNVKSILRVEYEGKMKFGEYQLQGILGFSLSHFNSKGLLIEINMYSSDSSLVKKTMNKYNEKGWIIESNEFNYYSDRNNPDNRIIYGHKFLTYKFVYNEEGNLLDETVFDPDNKILRKLINKFDFNRNLIESKDYNSDGELVGKYLFTKDKQGNYIEEKFGDIHGIYGFMHIKKYDSEGKIIEEIDKITTFFQDLKTLYTYDNLGNLTTQINHFNDTKNDIKDKLYNNIIDYFYKYEYDKTGNWIKQYIFDYQIQSGTIVRTIEYY